MDRALGQPHVKRSMSLKIRPQVANKAVKAALHCSLVGPIQKHTVKKASTVLADKHTVFFKNVPQLQLSSTV
jgi:hypothetical protein